MSKSLRWFARIRGPLLFGEAAGMRWVRLQAGQPLIIVREPENRVHSKAIRVHDVLLQPVGYVEAAMADKIAPYMDAGVVLLAKVAKPAKVWQFPYAEPPEAVIWSDGSKERTTQRQREHELT